MLKVAQLIKFISDLNPQNTPARLAFYNFLKGFALPEENLTPELIEKFFIYCLDYPHWAANKSQLGHEVKFLLENFNSFYQQRIDLTEIDFPQDQQVIEIEHFADLLKISESYLKRQYPSDCKIRTLSDQNRRVIALVLKTDRSLDIFTFDKKCTIRGGHIEPLRTDLVLHYSADLELKEGVLQKLEVAPYITAHFTVKANRLHGLVIRGYVFQKLLELKNELLSEQPRVLFPIKRIEQFFIDRKSDPYYQEIVSELERTTNLIRQGDQEASKWSHLALTKAETALENVFIGDKLLGLLVKDLRHASQAVSTNSNFYRAGDESIRPARKTIEESEECLKIMPIQKFDLTN
ncbi:MAG: hypothetical protein ACLGGX_09740 [Bdellovibrionia bacterium]